MLIDIPAFHRMKHPNRIMINDIVINLKRVCVPVKTDKQPFVFGIFIVFETPVIFNGINGPPNIGLAYPMLESRLAKPDDNVYVSSVYSISRKSSLRDHNMLNVPQRFEPQALQPSRAG